MAYLVPITVHIKQREDGSFLATGEELPILLAARDLQALKEKLRGIQASIDSYLQNMSEDERVAFLRDRGIGPEQHLDMRGGFSMPVLVGG